MRSVQANSTIVVVGSWNLAIVNPEWGATSLFRTEGVEAEFLISEAGYKLKFRHNNVSVTPEPGRIVIGALVDTPECLEFAEATTMRLLELLPVTPVTAVGINFGYHEEQVAVDLAALFNTSDVARFAGEGLALTSSEIRRTLQFEDRQLRLRLSMTENAELGVHLNYHKAVQSGPEGRESLEGRVVRYRQHSLDFLRNMYGLQLEERPINEQ